MTTITLESIKVEQTRLVQMIAAYEKQAKITKTISLPEFTIELKVGEHYAGIVLGKDGEANYHLILLPQEAESVEWGGAKEFATSVEGELPTRREQALLYANLKEHFQAAWYWSSEQHASDADYAWGQYFNDGDQDLNHKSYEGRARAVRRLVIS